MYQLIKKGLAVLAAAFVAVTAFAQVTTSSLGGRITEDGGEPLAGAAVIAVHTPSGTQYAAITNNDGRYAIQGMRTGGPYTVEVSFLGMGTLRYEDITLKLGEPYELNAELKSTNELNAVTVVAEKSFNASITGAGSSFSQRVVETMPTIDRSIYDVVKYTPQASMNKGGGISFSGANNRYNSFQIDGAVANDTFGLSSSGTNGGQTDANPVALDAIEEIQVVVAPFDVRQSGFTGGAINAITKSGTNTVKGSAYTYYTNQELIGTTPGNKEQVKYFNADGKRTKYEKQYSETFGFTVGGPIIKNKLFLFLSGEYYKNSRPNIYTPANASYEKDDLKLSQTVELEDGSTYDYFNAELAEKLISFYEKTYKVSNTGENFKQHQIDIRSYNVLARLDWNINEANKLMLRYQYMDAFKDRYASNYRTYYYNNSSYLQANKTNTFVAELNSRISPAVSNMLRATAVFVRDHRDIPYKGANNYIKDKVYVNIGTEYSSGGNRMNSDTYTITDNLSWYLGKHELTFGTHNEIYKFDNLFLQYAFGEYEFASLNDYFHNSPAAFYYRYSDPAVTGSNDTTNWAAATYAAQFGLYAQDEWKPNTNLTLTYGLRVDMPVLLNKPTENPEFNNGPISAASGEKVGVVPRVVPLWSPRVGFRWFLNDSHATLLRGGAGLFTGRIPFVWISNAYNNTGMETKYVRVNQPEYGKFPFTSDPYNDIVKAGLAEEQGGQATINTLNRNFKYPQVFRANLGFEQVFGGGWKFTFDGLFSKTLNNVFFKNLALQQKGVVYGVDAANAHENSVAPYYTTEDIPYNAVIALLNTNKGYTYSFSGQIQKHFDFGLDLMAAYTFGHAYSVNDGTSSIANSNWQGNPSVDTNGMELGHSLFDKTHKLTGVVSYRTPKYLGGRLQSTFTLSYEAGSGQRFSYTMNENAVDFNNDGRTGNSLLYIPTQAEIGQMNWSTPGDAAAFERYIRDDSYLSSHRGRWSERFAAEAPFEHHFDFQFAQDFLYDRRGGRKVQLTLDILNVGNLLNRAWGMYYSSVTSRQILTVTASNLDAAGNMTPTYRFDPQTVNLADFNSRWRMQVGVRFTF